MTETRFLAEAVQQHGNAGLEIVAYVPSLEDAQAIGVLFPKSVKVQATTISGNMLPDAGYEYGNPECVHRTFGFVRFRVNFERNGVTGDFNETGLKRYRSFQRTCRNFGFEITFRARYVNSFKTEAEFESYLQGA